MSLLGILKRELLTQSGLRSVCPGILSSLWDSSPTLHHSVSGQQGEGEEQIWQRGNQDRNPGFGEESAKSFGEIGAHPG